MNERREIYRAMFRRLDDWMRHGRWDFVEQEFRDASADHWETRVGRLRFCSNARHPISEYEHELARVKLELDSKGEDAKHVLRGLLKL